MTTALDTDKPSEKGVASAPSLPKEDEGKKLAEAKKQPLDIQSEPKALPETASHDDEKLMAIAPKMEDQSQSWGDRFKGWAFGGITHGVINYAINTFIAASFAYAFERYFKGHYENFVARVANGGKAVANAEQLNEVKGRSLYTGLKYGFDAVFLTVGGTSLLPIMKHAEENRQAYQYKLSRMLDKAQKSLGMSNEDTEKNLKDYEVIENIAVAKQAGKDPGVSEEEMKRLEDKYHFAFQDNGDIKFDTVKLTWGEVIKARAMAIAMSMGAGYLIGRTKASSAEKAELKTMSNAEQMAYQEAKEKRMLAGDFSGKYDKVGFGYLESKVLPKVKNTLEKVPGFTKLVDEPMLYAKNLFLDAILTVVSSATFFVASKKEEGVKEAEVDTNKDGWVSKQEATEFTQKRPGERIDPDIPIYDVQHHSSKTSKRQTIKPAAAHTDKIAIEREAAKDGTIQVAH